MQYLNYMKYEITIYNNSYLPLKNTLKNTLKTTLIAAMPSALNLVAISFLAASSCMIYTMLAPVYPIQAHKKGIPQSYVGQVVGIYSLASIAFSPFLSSLMKRYSKASLITFGLILMSLSLALLSILPFIQNKALFLLVSLVCRICQGIAQTTVSVCTLTIIQISSERSQQQRNISILDGVKNVGYSLAPVLASVIQEALGFCGVFAVFSGVLAVCAASSKLILKSSQVQIKTQQPLIDKCNSDVSTTDQSSDQYNLVILNEREEEEERSLITLGMLFKNKNILFPFIQIFMMALTYSYWEPLISLYLIKFNVSQGNIGYFFGLNSVCCMVFGLGPAFIPSRVNPRTILLIFNVLQSIGLLFIGPSQLLGANQNQVVLFVAIGVSLNGALFMYSFSTIIPSILRTINESYPSYSSQGVSQKLSIIFTVCRGSAITIGPVISTFLSSINFKLGEISEIFSFSLLSFTIIFFVVSGDLIKLLRCGKNTIKGLPSNSYKEVIYEDVSPPPIITVEDDATKCQENDTNQCYNKTKQSCYH